MLEAIAVPQEHIATVIGLMLACWLVKAIFMAVYGVLFGRLTGQCCSHCDTNDTEYNIAYRVLSLVFAFVIIPASIYIYNNVWQ